MKMKGIGAFERNIEKIVLGGVAAIFLGVVAMQFVRQPNLIDVDGKRVPPQDAYRDLQTRAEALTTAMNSVDPPVPPGASDVDLVARFREALQGDVAPAPRLAVKYPPLELGITGDDRQSLGARIAEVEPPAPTGAVAGVYLATIDPREVADAPELAKLVPAQQPFDKAAVTVEAVFDGTALRTAFRDDPDGENGVAPMPSSWWQDSAQILGVRLEREELAPTGEWSGLVSIGGMPGRNDFVTLAMAEDIVRKVDLDAVIGEAAADSESARRPDYYRTIAGPAWITPRESAEAAESGGTKTQIDRLLKKRAANEASLADLEDQLARAPDRPGDPPRQDPGRGPPGGGKGRGGQGPGQPPAPDAPSERIKARPQLEREIRTLKDRMARDDRDLAALGFKPDDGAREAGAAPAKSKPLLDDSEVRVWAHDLTAEPGKTYRYRARVVVNNPAFDRAAFISEEQASFAAKPVLFSAPSEWTSPLTVDGAECFFIVGASDGGEGPLGGTRATAELYRFYYGYWRQGRVNLEPGDILASSAKLPELFTYDLSKAADEGGAPPDGGGRSGRGLQGNAPVPDQGATPNPGQTPLAKDLPIVIEAVLLDVARAPEGWVAEGNRLSGGTTTNQALIRDSMGRIVARTPEQDRASTLYSRVSQSAREGVDQGAAPPPVDEGPTKNQPPKRPDREEKSPRDGGGGGGGGGGG